MCKERHLTTLHRLKVEKWNTSDKDNHDHKQKSEQDGKDTPSVKTFQCNSTYASSGMVSMCVVPVRVSHKQPNIVIKTYALLDSCSQGTFVTEEVLREMNLKGKGTTITMKTLNGEVTENSKVIEGLEVYNSSDLGQEFVKWLMPPKFYNRKDIPATAMTPSSQINYPNGNIWIELRASFLARKI